MAYDNEVKIKTKMDNSELEKGAKDAGKTIKSLAKEINSNTRGITSMAVGFNAVSNSISIARNAFSSVSATVKDLTETYKAQAKAETQLETAAKNNPYLDESSVRKLKKYAGELQGISTVGDEQLIPMMARLAAAGRTQAEIQEIMSAALDISASGAMSLESAVQGLNASYSGQVGLLGKAVPSLKNLTEAELKQGKAVAAVAKQYKGMAKETAAATGSAEQLANAWGDFKENIGRGLEEALSPVRRKFTEILGDINDLMARSKELADANKNISLGEATTADYDVKIEQTKKNIESLEKLLEKHRQEYKNTGIDNGIQEVRDELRWQLDILRVYNTEKGKLVSTQMKQAELERKAADEAERNAAAQRSAEEAKKRMNDLALNALDAYKKSVDGVENEIKAREQLGEIISEHEKAQMRYEARYGGYINLITSAQGALSGTLDREKSKLEEIKKLAKELADYENSPEAKADKFAEEGKERKATIEVEWKVKKEDLEKARTEIQNLQEALVEDQSITVEQRTALEEKYAAAIEEINAQIEEGEKESNARRMQNFVDMMGTIKSYADQTVSVINDAMNLMAEAVQNQCDAELATLELKYRQGEMGEEEYNEAVTEAKKKAAKEQYKIQMVQWAASILQATANIAEGVTKAIAQGGIAGIATGAIVAAAGAVQMASIVASKPTPPSFATGGIVPGNSYSGDRVLANVNSGEMILNAAQQRSLWEAANGRGAGGGANVVVNNSAANIVSAKPQITEDSIKILIDARVNEGLKSGKYDQSLTMAEQGMGGEMWGI